MTLEFLLRALHIRQPEESSSEYMINQTLSAYGARRHVRSTRRWNSFAIPTDARWLVPHSKDVVRQQRSSRGVYCAGVRRRRAIHCSGASRRKRPTGCCAICARPQADSFRPSMPIRRGTKASSMSGRRTRFATCSSPCSTRRSRAGLASIARPISKAGGTCTHSSRSPTSPLQLALDEAAVATRIDEARAQLLAARNARVWPGRDVKVLTSWNGMTIGGLARASRALGRDDLADAALQAMRFLRGRCWRDGRLLAVHTDGDSRFPAYLDDYAMLAWGLLELVEARWDADALAWAIELVEVMLARFTDHEAGGFYLHGRRSRVADPAAEDRLRRCDAGRQRRGGTLADPSRIPAGRDSLHRRGGSDAALGRCGDGTVSARARHAADGARGIRVTAVDSRAARSRPTNSTCGAAKWTSCTTRTA